MLNPKIFELMKFSSSNLDTIEGAIKNGIYIQHNLQLLHQQVEQLKQNGSLHHASINKSNITFDIIGWLSPDDIHHASTYEGKPRFNVGYFNCVTSFSVDHDFFHISLLLLMLAIYYSIFYNYCSSNL